MAFCELICQHVREQDALWIFDYHLFLLPAFVRNRLAETAPKIGLFLNVPFPTSEIFRMSPVREEMVLGMLGAHFAG